MSHKEVPIGAPFLGPINEEVDPYLHGMVRLASRNIGRIQVSLNIAGAVVYGTIIPPKTYLRKAAENMFAGTEEDKARDDTESLVRMFSETPGDVAPMDQLDFIHLEDVVVVIGNVKQGLALWRGKLSKVEGFSFTGIPSEFNK